MNEFQINQKVAIKNAATYDEKSTPNDANSTDDAAQSCSTKNDVNSNANTYGKPVKIKVAVNSTKNWSIVKKCSIG